MKVFLDNLLELVNRFYCKIYIKRLLSNKSSCSLFSARLAKILVCV